MNRFPLLTPLKLPGQWIRSPCAQISLSSRKEALRKLSSLTCIEDREFESIFDKMRMIVEIGNMLTTQNAS